MEIHPLPWPSFAQLRSLSLMAMGNTESGLLLRALKGIDLPEGIPQKFPQSFSRRIRLLPPPLFASMRPPFERQNFSRPALNRQRAGESDMTLCKGARHNRVQGF